MLRLSLLSKCPGYLVGEGLCEIGNSRQFLRLHEDLDRHPRQQLQLAEGGHVAADIDLSHVEGFPGLRIALGGRAVALPGIHLPPHRRQVAVVPQEGALFPHLSVTENVGFGLTGRDRRRTQRVQECLELVGLSGLGARMPHELSGGQQQRVALARALAPRPPLVLLDEPFSALDASLRVELRHDVRAALREAGATAILVTHDQGEALSMADRVAVMRDGEVRQVGTPEEVYLHPVDAWVASFVGEADLLPLTLQDSPGTPSLPLGSSTLRIDTPLGPVSVTGTDPDLGATHVVIRPEQVVLGQHGVPAVVRSVDFHGHDALVTLELADGATAHARTGAHPPEVGARVLASVSGLCRAVPGGGVGPAGGAGRAGGAPASPTS